MQGLRGPTLRRLVAVALLGLMGAGALQLLDSGPQTGQRLDPLRLALSDGTMIDLGGEPTVVTFWGSWCAPCRREAPILNALHEEGVPVIGIAMDPDPMPALKQKAAGVGIRYPIVAERSELARTFGVQALPTTFVLAPDRTVVLAHAGVVTGAVLQKALSAASSD